MMHISFEGDGDTAWVYRIVYLLKNPNSIDAFTVTSVMMFSFEIASKQTVNTHHVLISKSHVICHGAYK